RQAAAARARQALRRGAGIRRAEAGAYWRQMERALFRPPFSAQREIHSRAEEAQGQPRAAPAAREAVLPPRVLARGVGRNQLPALLRDHPPRRGATGGP